MILAKDKKPFVFIESDVFIRFSRSKQSNKNYDENICFIFIFDQSDRIKTMRKSFVVFI